MGEMETDKTNNSVRQNSDRFKEHLNTASEIVKTWPKWKQGVLGRSTQSTDSQSGNVESE